MNYRLNHLLEFGKALKAKKEETRKFLDDNFGNFVVEEHPGGFHYNDGKLAVDMKQMNERYCLIWQTPLGSDIMPCPEHKTAAEAYAEFRGSITQFFGGATSLDYERMTLHKGLNERFAALDAKYHWDKNRDDKIL